MTPRSTGPWILFAGALLLCACSTVRTNQPAGAACVRSAECAAGLACVAQMCTTDIGPLAEGGTLPPLDFGTAIDGAIELDAGDVDAGSMAGDAGASDFGAPLDLGPPPTDMGTPEVDMGTPEVDMGAPEVDMGAPEVDAGDTPVDAG